MVSAQRARILITVKTYPELSHKYRETSCVAGIRLDKESPQLVRLFPVPFRLLDENSQFSKYSIIEVDVNRHDRDKRPESLRPDLESLKIVGHLSSNDGWKRRYTCVKPLVSPSLCAIKRDQRRWGVSLGVFKPAEVSSFRLVPAEPWSIAKAGLADQLDLFEHDLARLEWIPYEFRYSFRCVDDDCLGHDMNLKDWEAGASYRKFLRMYGKHEAINELQKKWFEDIFTSSRSVHFFVGNIAARPGTFMLLGLFYPQREVVERAQDDLFEGIE